MRDTTHERKGSPGHRRAPIRNIREGRKGSRDRRRRKGLIPSTREGLKGSRDHSRKGRRFLHNLKGQLRRNHHRPRKQIRHRLAKADRRAEGPRESPDHRSSR